MQKYCYSLIVPLSAFIQVSRFRLSNRSRRMSHPTYRFSAQNDRLVEEPSALALEPKYYGSLRKPDLTKPNHRKIAGSRFGIDNNSMMRRQCQECRTVVFDAAPYCDACGGQLLNPSARFHRWRYAISCAAVGFAPWLFEHFVLGWF
jgi:hypothetical protein